MSRPLLAIGVCPWAALLDVARKMAYMPKSVGWDDLLITVTVAQLACLAAAFMLAVRR